MKKIYLLVFGLLLAFGSILGQTRYGSYTGTQGGNTNSFFGYGAGQYTTSSQNTFIGYYSGRNSTTGIWNTFVGTNAGKQNSGNSGTFMGFDAGKNNKGSMNNFFGNSSGRDNSTGTRNSFFGHYSGVANTTGYDNLFFGYQSGGLNTSGYKNIYVGSQAGYSSSSGDNNTYIGHQSGYNNTTGSGNVFLGYQSGYNETGSNKLYIDNSSTSSPLIYGDFNANTLAFNGVTTINGAIKGNKTGGSLRVQTDHGYIDVGPQTSSWAHFSTDRARYRFNKGLTVDQGLIGSLDENLQLQTSGTTRITVNNSTGNVGIGLTSPSQKLDVNGHARVRSNLYMDDGDILNIHGIQMKDWDDDTGGTNNKYRLLARDGAFQFYNGGVVVGSYSDGQWSDLPDGRLIVEDRVGIGTPAPNQKLHVQGSSYTDVSIILGNRGRADMSSIAGQIYFDQNYSENYSEMSDNGGGLSIYTEDGWGAIMATNNSQWITPTFNGGVFNSDVALGNTVIGTSDNDMLKIETGHGITYIGAGAANWSSFNTDMDKFYFNTQIHVDGAISSSNANNLILATGGDAIPRMTISHLDGDVSVNANLLVGGTIKFNADSLTIDNAQDSLMVVRGDGSLAVRSVRSIESPWLLEFFAQDSAFLTCDTTMMGSNTIVDVFDLNGNLRIGDGSYIDDDIDYGDINDDWMRFNERIEFMSSGDRHGIVLYDKNTFLDYTNIYQEGGTTYMANDNNADTYFLKAEGRNVTFGGEVLMPSLDGTENFSVASWSNLYLSIDSDNNSETNGETNAISFGVNGKGLDPNYNEFMRIEESGGIFMNNLPVSTTLEHMMVVDANNQIHYRDVNTLKLSPWDINGIDIAYTTGNVSIGAAPLPSGYKLAVDGKILAEELKVQLSETWPDYVFEESYELMPLQELKEYVKEEKHLPNIPSQDEVAKEEGVNLGEMNQKLLEKVEELTLYLIQENERISNIEAELKKLKEENESLKLAMNKK